MNPIVPVLLVIAAVIPSLPLIVLVTRADRIRSAIEALEWQCNRGLISPKEFEDGKLQLLHRSLWRQWKDPNQKA